MQAKCDATFLQARDSGLEAEGFARLQNESACTTECDPPPQSNAKLESNKPMPTNNQKDGNIITKLL